MISECTEQITQELALCTWSPRGADSILNLKGWWKKQQLGLVIICTQWGKGRTSLMFERLKVVQESFTEAQK